MLQNWQLEGLPYFWTFISHFLQILEVLLLLKTRDKSIYFRKNSKPFIKFHRDILTFCRLMLTFLVEIRIYSRYIWQLERSPCTPYIAAALETTPQMDDGWSICYKQTTSVQKIDHEKLLQKLPSSFPFVENDPNLVETVESKKLTSSNTSESNRILEVRV